MIGFSALDAVVLVAVVTVAFDYIRLHNVVVLAVGGGTHTT